MKNQKKTKSSTQLLQLFEDELKDIYWAEKAIVKAMPKMIKNATSPELIEALTSHLAETKNQISRAEKVFDFIDKKATAKKCDAMEGLIKEAEEKMDSCEQGVMCDAGIIASAQKIEHYEIASYGTLCAFAKTLGEGEAAELLQETLDEEKATDLLLSDIAESINAAAANEEELEESSTSSKA